MAAVERRKDVESSVGYQENAETHRAEWSRRLGGRAEGKKLDGEPGGFRRDFALKLRFSKEECTYRNQ